MTQRAGRRLTSLTLGLVCLAAATGAHAKSRLLTGTIILGAPRSDFVVVGADRLWTNALAKPGDPPWKRQGPQGKIALHPTLPLAIATAGLATLDAEQDTVSYIRELITPLDVSRLDLDTIVELLRPHLHEKILALRNSARRALAANPADADAKIRLQAARQTLVIAYVTAGRASLGWVQVDDEWKAKRETPPHGAVAWPTSLDHFYRTGPFASTAKLFGHAITDRAGLVQHVRHVIEAGIREEARLHQGQNRQVGGPVDVVLVDAKGARCVPACPPP
jgi:hypothetical protein